MSINNIQLPLDLEAELTTEASRLDLPVTEYILRILSLRASIQNPPKTGAELLDYWESVGVVGSRPDITDGPEYALKLRNEAETRERV